jgi:hypothetical protein
MILVEIIMAATHHLGPKVHLVFQCIKTAIWTGFFLVVIRNAAVGDISGLSIFLVAALL